MSFLAKNIPLNLGSYSFKQSNGSNFEDIIDIFGRGEQPEDKTVTDFLKNREINVYSSDFTEEENKM